MSDKKIIVEFDRCYKVDLDKEKIQNIKDAFEKIKRAFVNIVEKIKSNKELFFLIRLSQDEEIKKYMRMYKKVKTKRLKKKYKNKIDKRINYIKKSNIELS